MHEPCIYRIKVRGGVDESDLNALSPLQITMAQTDADEEPPYAATRFVIHADQSGLIGLMRHLHGRGFVLLSVTREQ
jgi:hypothetical protein